MPETSTEIAGVDFGIACEGLSRNFSGAYRMDSPMEDIPVLVYRTSQGIKRNAVDFADLSTVGGRSRTGVGNRNYFIRAGWPPLRQKKDAPALVSTAWNRW